MPKRTHAQTPKSEAREGHVLVWIKAVAGASRDEIAGVIGDRLKVRVTAPAEGGRANKAICALLAKRFGVKKNQVTLESGHGNPEKDVRIAGGTRATIEAMLPL